LGKRFLFL